MAVKRTFRLSEENADKLRRLAEARGTTATEIVNAAISEYGTEQNASNTVSGGSHTESSTDDGALVAELRDRIRYIEGMLDRKEKRIEELENSLTGALKDTQESLKAAQALHAHAVSEPKAMETTAEPKAMETTDQKRSRWRRLVDAWSG